MITEKSKSPKLISISIWSFSSFPHYVGQFDSAENSVKSSTAFLGFDRNVGLNPRSISTILLVQTIMLPATCKIVMSETDLLFL